MATSPQFSSYSHPYIAINDSGNGVVVWSEGNDRVWGQRIDANLQNVGVKFEITTAQPNGTAFPEVRMDDEGDFVVLWKGSSLFARIYDADGTPTTGPIVISTQASTRNSLAVDADGDFVIAWDNGTGTVRAQRFDELGVAQGSTITLGTNPSNPFTDVAVACDADGDFVVVWETLTNQGGGIFNAGPMMMARFTNTGSLISTGQMPNTTSAAASPAIDMTSDGRFVVVWSSNLTHYQVFSAAGASTYVGSIATGGVSYTDLSVSVNEIGDFVIGRIASAGNRPFVQRFTASGLPDGPQTGVDYNMAAGYPTVAIKPNGEFLVSYGANSLHGGGPGQLRIAPFTLVTNTPPVAHAGGPYYITPGSALPLRANQSFDPDGFGPLTYSWDLNGDMVFGDFVSPNANSTVSASQLAALGIGPGVYTIRVRVSDTNDSTISDPTTLTIRANQAPVANGGSGYSVLEGGSFALDATASFDPDGDALSFFWDLDGDGSFNDATGATPTVDWAQLGILGPDGPSVDTIQLRVVDVFNAAVTTSPISVTIINAPPSAAMTNIPLVVRGQTRTYTLNAGDPSSEDAVADFTFNIDWDGDGIFDQTVVGPAGATVQHTFEDVGQFTVRVTATDKDGDTSPVFNYAYEVRAYELVANGSNPSLTDMVWYGSLQSDLVTFDSTAPNEVRFYTTSDDPLLGTTVSGVTGSLIVFGRAGNDELTFDGLMDVNTSGGDGNDTLVVQNVTDARVVLRGEDGDDVLALVDGTYLSSLLEGGDDNDSLTGAGSNDVLWGGMGNDTAWGGLGEDLIAGEGGDDVIYGEAPVVLNDLNSSGELEGDTIDGGAGNDTIYGDSDGGEGGSDLINGGDDNDVIVGDGAEGNNEASDTIYGGSGDDVIEGDAQGAEGAADMLFGEDGNDILDGGAANDTIEGGIGDDALLGGDGGEGADDSLSGGDGRDLLAGDGGFSPRSTIKGADTLLAGPGDDILISGWWSPENTTVVMAVMAEWTSARTYLERIANLSGTGVGPRENGDVFLVPGVNVLTDESVDELFGESDEDWFLATLANDVLSDVAGGEVVTAL